MKDMKNVTIKDVAARANVAVSTVSRVLNNSSYVSESTRERVLQAIRELNYHPNNLARGLTTGKTGVIGLMIPDITNPFFPVLARGVEDAANARGYAVILCNTDGNSRQEEVYLQMLREQRVDGIIFSSASSGRQVIEDLLSERMPLVLIDRKIEGVKVNTVIVDNLGSSCEITRYIIGKGHRRIGFIGGPHHLATSRDRLAGYRMALSEAGIPVDEDLIKEGDFRYSSGYANMQALFELGVTAVFAANDLMAIGAIRALEEMGKGVPQDVAVAGFDDIMMASLIKPALTTVCQPTYRMGVIAADLLIDQIAGNACAEPDTIVLKPNLVIRESC